MLDAWIIEEMKRREREREFEQQRPALQLPLPEPMLRRPPEPVDEDHEPREGGVIIIDIS